MPINKHGRRVPERARLPWKSRNTGSIEWNNIRKHMSTNKRVYLTQNGNYWNYSRGLPFPSRQGIQKRWKYPNGRIIIINLNKPFPMINRINHPFVAKLDKFFGRPVLNAPNALKPNKKAQLRKQLNNTQKQFYEYSDRYQNIVRNMGKNWFRYLTNWNAKHEKERKMKNLKYKMELLQNQSRKIAQNLRNMP